MTDRGGIGDRAVMIEDGYSPPRRVSKTQMGHYPASEISSTQQKIGGTFQPTFRQTENFIFNTFLEKKREQANDSR